jgi:hypothetical protein
MSDARWERTSDVLKLDQVVVRWSDVLGVRLIGNDLSPYRVEALVRGGGWVELTGYVDEAEARSVFAVVSRGLER